MVIWAISIAGSGVDQTIWVRGKNNEKVIFENFAPCSLRMSEINDTEIYITNV